MNDTNNTYTDWFDVSATTRCLDNHQFKVYALAMCSVMIRTLDSEMFHSFISLSLENLNIGANCQHIISQRMKIHSFSIFHYIIWKKLKHRLPILDILSLMLEYCMLIAEYRYCILLRNLAHTFSLQGKFNYIEHSNPRHIVNNFSTLSQIIAKAFYFCKSLY